jgi:hypothetical protein
MCIPTSKELRVFERIVIGVEESPVSERVAHRAGCSVLVIREKDGRH